MREAEFAPPRWERYPKHRKRGRRAEKMWERSILAAQTGVLGEPAVYAPHLTDVQVRDMEMSCVPGEGRGLGTELPQRACNLRRFYRRFADYIGASEGKKTDYIMVQYDQSGCVHGYPVTVDYLRSRGAIIQ
jgi:hypothetical protein